MTCHPISHITGLKVRLEEEILEFYVREASSGREREKALLPALGP